MFISYLTTPSEVEVILPYTGVGRYSWIYNLYSTREREKEPINNELDIQLHIWGNIILKVYCKEYGSFFFDLDLISNFS
jgi:hypothetical protein